MINSILDNDLYTFTVGQAVLEHYPHAVAEYQFTSRKPTPVNLEFVKLLKEKIESLKNLELSCEEFNYIANNYLFISPAYLKFISQFKFDPSQVEINWDENKPIDLKENFSLKIKGTWASTIFWEVPLLALISECYYQTVDLNWSFCGQSKLIEQKGKCLDESKCKYADFGTRRRRSYESQDLVVKSLNLNSGFVGTSNVHFAQKYNVKAIGTMSHQWIMGVSGLESLRHANRFALEKWQETFKGNLGIALPDTFGTDAFFEDFGNVNNKTLAKLFDGVRHDSGDPVDFLIKTVDFYKSIGIDPLSKTIVFSDGLDPLLACGLQEQCRNKIQCSFGIGTNFTNSFANSPALNMVIKLRSISRTPNLKPVQVIKLSDVPTKATGDKDALRVAKYTFFGTPLDEVTI